jgi:asparagine synthase (glutamine-hydrolysing)
MCGIVGFKEKHAFETLAEDLPHAVSRLIMRGPDDSGLFFDQGAGIGLGHRRLSVIDLSSAGRQPMTNDEDGVCIVYNGEIYNFLEIRRELESHGHPFKTQTDTEVVLKAYIQWGIEAIDRFVGMFAFAIWDPGKDRLLLARDRMGIKPLYYCHRDGRFIFASELKAIMAFKGFEKEVDPDSIPLFLHYQYIPTPGTVFKQTFKLPPGHMAILERGHLGIRPYWSRPEPDFGKRETDFKEETLLEGLADLLEKAVSDRLISDVPLGALLSGGIDSSLIVALMQKVNKRSTRTFSIGFEDSNFNEAPWAKRIARHLGTDHTEFYVGQKEAMDVIPRLPEIYDEPFADSSAVPTYLVSQVARSHVTVALSGDGGDEQFCGYVRYWSTGAMAKGDHLLPRHLKRLLSSLTRKIPPSWVESCYLPWRDHLPQRFRVANFHDKWQKFIKMMGEERLSELYRMTVCLWPVEELGPLMGRELPESSFEEIFMATEGWPLLARLMRVDQETYLPDAMLTKVDRASMSVSLEVRVPLLDHRIVEFTAAVPDRFKYRDGMGKYLLKKLLARFMPVHLFDRPKMGFGVPIHQWLRDELRPLLLDYLSTERLEKEGLFSPRLVERKIKEHLSGKFNHKDSLWSLLVWELWRERWLK